ncbi:MAG: ubiquinone biosynthesis protein, partial [Propionibacteriaceae bacterium]|nr:ubiquinone biosynthesis protein [Propionibacteriaceae bacterium]
PWVAELAAIWHTVSGDQATDRMRHLPVLGAGFGPVTSVTIDWAQPMLLADLAELVTTRSYYLSAPPTERNQIDADVAAFLRAQFPAVDTVHLPYRTHCFRAGLA